MVNQTFLKSMFFGALAVIVTACASTTSSYIPKGETYAAKPVNHPITVYSDANKIEKAYVEIAEVFTSSEAHLQSLKLEDALVELKIQAREAGGDAIIDIKEKRSRHLEAGLYIVEATAIRFTE